MRQINLITRRNFFDQSAKVGLTAALTSLIDIPMVAKRALAGDVTDGLGINGKKLLFIFLRGANDGLNSVIPVGDSAYNLTNRPQIMIPSDPGVNYSATTGVCDYPVNALPTDPTFSYDQAIRLGNGFAALHPSLKFLAPVYNAGDLALIHRVAYPKQSRSHFDSQAYWETGSPNNSLVKDGIFYRTIMESGLAHKSALTGVSIQSSLPLCLRGSDAAMTNLSDPTRYNLLGIPNTTEGNNKADVFLREAAGYSFPQKRNRDLLSLQYQNLSNTLNIFSQLDFSEAGNTFIDDAPIDGDDVPYYLFPTSNAKNGGYAAHGNAGNKYVVDTGAYDFFNDLRAAATVLNKTDAIIAGTRLDGFDTHSTQGAATGPHANLQRRIAWAIYGLRKYFTKYADKATWNNLVVITMSEFGRTSVENSDAGTDHGEAGVMFVAGGSVKGYGKAGVKTSVYGVNPTDTVPWQVGQTGSMFGDSSKRYLKRAVDYRSVLGKVIRDHLGATQGQLDRIIPGYTVAGERLKTGGVSTKDGVTITGELPLV